MIRGLFQPMHLLLIAGLILLIFPHNAGDLMSSLGKGIKNFKKGLHGEDGE